MSKKQFSYNRAFTSTDWDSASIYNPDIIDGIVDPGGGKNTSPANAIPSPFARMDLVRTAFRNAAQGKSDFSDLTEHDFKLISDAWDVGELFFRRDELFEAAANVKIIEWDRLNRVNGLIASSHKGHQKLGKALQLFLGQDKEGFNFDSQQHYYLFQRNFKTYGGTSPITMFFGSADPLPTDISHLGDIFFDEGIGKWKHLHERGDDFQEYIYLLFEAGNFRASMKAVDDYLTRSFDCLQQSNQRLYQRVGSIRQLGTPLPVAGTPDRSKQQLADGYLRENYHLQTESQHQVKILGYPLYTPRVLQDPLSDFFIDSQKNLTNVLVPLNEDASFNISENGLTYYGGPWQADYRRQVPFKSADNWKSRNIPATTGKKGAVLFIGDLLEDVIMKVNYPIDKARFFSLYGDAAGKTHDYLLPLKKTFFEFFDHSQLIGLIDGKKFIELEEIGSAVKIYLRVPVKSNISNGHIGHVEFSKIYSTQVDSERNKGMILQDQTGFGFDLGIAMTPAVRWSIKPDYRVHLMDLNSEKFFGQVELVFHSNSDGRVSAVRTNERINKKNTERGSKFYSVKKSFDWIDVSYEFQDSIREAKVIPLWSEVSSNVKYDVSVDFGTTNTHIELRTHNSAASSGFETERSSVIATLFDTQKGGAQVSDLIELMNQEFVPELIADTYRFPKRTVISHSKNYTLGGHANSFALGDYNYPFVYEIAALPPNHSEVHTDLKWSMEHDTSGLLEGFIENIALLVRSKILADGGNPKQANFFITHPSSMTAARVTMIENAWGKQLDELFGITDDGHLTTLTESLAPYIYYRKTNAVAAFDRPVVSIDIGGGTTDIIVVDRNVPSIVTSLRFAGNSLFGDGYNSSSQANGFIKRYLLGVGGYNGYFREIEKAKGTLGVYNQLVSKSSTDIISFLFSLKNSKDLESQGIHIDLAEDLKKDRNLRTVFVTFGSAIIYHVARQMKAKGLRPPSDILLSGTGSRILTLFDTSKDKRHLSVLAKAIFRQVFTNDDIPDNIKIRMDDNPKELTAKGAILFDKTDFIKQFTPTDPSLNSVQAVMQKLTQTYIGMKGTDVKFGTDFEYETVRHGGYTDYVKAEFDEFIQCMESIYRDNTLVNEFDVQADDWSKAMKGLKDHFVNGLKEGMDHKFKEVNDKKSHLNEPPFFYPFHYSLCLIANDLIE